MSQYNLEGGEDIEFDEQKFFDGKKEVRIEGRVWKRGYRLMDNVVKPRSMGGTVLFDGICGDVKGCSVGSGGLLTGKVVRGGKELWLQAYPGDTTYNLIVVETEEMKQDVTVNDLLKALNEQGRVAIYINFDVDKATIRPESQPTIGEIVALLKGNPSLKVSVEGHTDNTGVRQRNKTLSEQRAKAVADAIVQQGVDRSRLTSVGWGQDKPIEDNGTEAGRAKNRRVELVKK
jgi:outer membrane protein OmpA-like peptidoglycan-associated protein